MSKWEIIEPQKGDKRYVRRDEHGEFASRSMSASLSLLTAATRQEWLCKRAKAIAVTKRRVDRNGFYSLEGIASRAVAAGARSGRDNPCLMNYRS
jgi:hypothetical protein